MEGGYQSFVKRIVVGRFDPSDVNGFVFAPMVYSAKAPRDYSIAYHLSGWNDPGEPLSGIPMPYPVFPLVPLSKFSHI